MGLDLSRRYDEIILVMQTTKHSAKQSFCCRNINFSHFFPSNYEGSNCYTKWLKLSYNVTKRYDAVRVVV